MSNERCKMFFETKCKVTELKQKDVISIVTDMGGDEYEIGKYPGQETIKAHCIWCARNETTRLLSEN